MAQFFRCNIRSMNHFNGNGAQVTKDFFTCRVGKDSGYILADFYVAVLRPLYAINPNINLLVQLPFLVPATSVVAVAVPFAALLQLFVYAVLHHESSCLVHQIFSQDE